MSTSYCSRPNTFVDVVIFDALIKNEGNNGTSYLTVLQNKDTELIYHLR